MILSIARWISLLYYYSKFFLSPQDTQLYLAEKGNLPYRGLRILSMGDFLLLMLLILSNHIYSLSLAIAASIQDILPVYFAQFPVSF